MDFNKTALQFIPIILVFLLLTYSKSIAIFSHTILGKLVAIALIIYYTVFDKLVGLFVCSLVIFYYQMDYVESMLNLDIGLFSPVSSNIADSIDEIYIGGIPLRSIEPFSQAKADFRSQNCSKGVLKYKDMTVRDEMADHVFQEIEFEDDSRCNVCSDSCSFSIIESRLNKESEMKPTMSR
jgi:hypothetical protein